MNQHRAVLLLLAASAAAVSAQVTPMDVVFAGLSARTTQLAYTQHGGDMKPIAPLMAEASNADKTVAYRGLTHAMALMSGRAWTPDSELATALDFSVSAKAVGTGEYLATRATFLFDAPAATQAPYRLQLDLLNAEGSKEKTVEPGIVLGDVSGRKAGETIGLTFDPSKIAQPGLHTLRATLQDGHGTTIFEYYRSFFVVTDLSKRYEAAMKTLDLLPNQTSEAALAARQILETVTLANRTYYGTGFQNLTGYIYTGMRAAGLGTTEAIDFDAALTRATLLTTGLKEGQDALVKARGDVGMAYRSSFDGKLVPYRIYLPTNYDKSKKYPLVVLLHGAGGDETNFLEAYGHLWPKLAEQRGYILASVNGRGPLSGYRKETGGEQDVLDVLDLMKSHFSIDASRVYLGGHSMGGGGTWAIGLKYPDRFAGLIPIAGSSAMLAPGLEAGLKAGKRIPVMMVCGVKDALVPVAGCRAIAEKAKALNAPVKYAEYAEGDHLSVAVISIPDIFDWLDAQTKAGMSAVK
jgi:poly(3-hydroxybutyrate) depolymerase